MTSSPITRSREHSSAFTPKGNVRYRNTSFLAYGIFSLNIRYCNLQHTFDGSISRRLKDAIKNNLPDLFLDNVICAGYEVRLK